MRAITFGSRNRLGSSRLRLAMLWIVYRIGWMNRANPARNGSGFRLTHRPCGRGSPQQSALLRSRREHLLEPRIVEQLAFLLRRLFEELLHHHVGVHAFGSSGEVRQDAVPQNRIRQRLDVFGRDVSAPIEESARLAAE